MQEAHVGEYPVVCQLQTYRLEPGYEFVNLAVLDQMDSWLYLLANLSFGTIVVTRQVSFYPDQ